MAAAGASGSLESTLDKRLQAVTNTMDSIQGLSMWCIENKKYHSVVVRCWMKWLRKSDASHRLNLFYVANDIIQNCKRKGAVVYRTAFADLLPDAFLLISHDSNAKVLKSVERILSIWEDRSVYTDNLITELRGYLVKEESPPASTTPVEQKTPVDSNAALKSKVLAEFVPQALVEQLSTYKSSLDEVELREKQLAAMRVDVCSTSALRRLKDKAGGKKFSKDFEDGSSKLQDFVKFLDQQSKGGPPLLEALNNADIFYEMQYQEVKIVANAYQTFANRVSHLKRKLDSLKTQLPDLDESPIPSPSADAPSPTGSESPFRGLETSQPDPDLDGSAMDDSAMDDEAEPPAPSPLSTPGGSPKVSPQVSPKGSPKHVFGESDNIEVEDMELSEDEMESGGIIVEEPLKIPSPEAVSSPVPVLPADTRPSLTSEAAPVTNATTSSSSSAAPAAPGLSTIDLNKMNSLISSLTSALKNTGAAVETPSPGPGSSLLTAQTAPSPSASVLPKDARSLVNMLSKVDMTPADLLNALAKARGQGSGVQGLASFFTNSVGAVSPSSDSSSTGKPPPSLSSTPPSAVSNSGPSLPSTTPVPSPPISAASHSPLRTTPQEVATKAPAPHVPAHQTAALPVAPGPFAPVPHAPGRQPSIPHVPAPQASVHQAAPLLTSSAASTLPFHAPTPLVPAPQAPAHQAPVHQVPVPRAPVPQAPVSQAPVSQAPVSQVPVSHAPVSQAPAHHAPVSQAPVSHAPVHQGPVPSVPAPLVPPHQIPVPHVPVHQGPAPRVPVPRALAPHVLASKAPAPKAAPILTSASALVSALHRDMDLLAEPEPEPELEPETSQSLDSKIHSFLHGNPGFSFSLGFASDDPILGGSPVIGTDTRDGTPVRDEGGGTPTQDEIMDKPAVDVFESSTKEPSAVDAAAKTTESKSPSIYQTSAWQDSANPQQHVHAQPGAAQNGQGYQPYPYGTQEGAGHGTAAPVECYQQIAGQAVGPTLGERAPINTSATEGGVGMGGWYSGRYPGGSVLPPGGLSVATPGGSDERQASHLYPYQAGQTQEPHGLASQQGAVASGLFKGILPPLPNLALPPGGLEALPTVAGSEMVPPQVPNAEVKEDMGVRTDSVIGRMVIHDHQHKSMFHTDDPPYHVDVHRPPDGIHRHPDGIRHPDDIYRHPDDIHRHPDDIHRHPDDIHRHPDDVLHRHPDNIHGHPDIFHPPLDDLRYQEDRRHFHDDLRRGDVLLPPDPRRLLDEPFYGPEDPYYGPESHFGPDPYRRSPSPPLYAHGRMLPPPPHHEMRHPGPWPRHRPPHPQHRPPRPRGVPRGGPRPLLQPFHGPDPRLQGKRPPRGGAPGGPMYPQKRPYLPPRF